MQSFPLTDVGHAVKDVIANAQQDASGDTIILTAGATEDAVECEGETIDRLGFDSMKLVIGYITTLTDTKTLSFGIKEQQSADGSTWDTATVVQAATVAVTSDGGGTEMGTVEANINLRSKKRYVRYNITPDLSATGTDTAIWTAVTILGGAVELPTS